MTEQQRNESLTSLLATLGGICIHMESASDTLRAAKEKYRRVRQRIEDLSNTPVTPPSK